MSSSIWYDPFVVTKLSKSKILVRVFDLIVEKNFNISKLLDY